MSIKTDTNILKIFGFARFELELKAIDPILLPAYKGSTLRGAFGHSFKKVVCTLKKKTCEDCILKRKCVYSYVFETPPPEDSEMMKKYTAAPHPFVIEPPVEKKTVYKPGEILSFGLILIGRAAEYLPYFIYAFSELGKGGLGKGRGAYTLTQVKRPDSGEVVYTRDGKITAAASKKTYLNQLFPTSRKLTLSFITPTRIKYGEELVTDLEFHILIRNLLRRISTLSYFHCGSPLDIDFKKIISDAQAIKVTKNGLSWHDWERYSNRQQTKMKLGGLVGEITFEGNLSPFMLYLVLGEQIHTGKGTSFGLGKYKIQLSN